MFLHSLFRSLALFCHETYHRSFWYVVFRFGRVGISFLINHLYVFSFFFILNAFICVHLFMAAGDGAAAVAVAIDCLVRISSKEKKNQNQKLIYNASKVMFH